MIPIDAIKLCKIKATIQVCIDYGELPESFRLGLEQSLRYLEEAELEEQAEWLRRRQIEGER